MHVPRPERPASTARCPASHRLETAGQIRRGRLKLGPFPIFRLPSNPTWRENPFRDVNWAFRYHTLRWVVPLIRTWHADR